MFSELLKYTGLADQRMINALTGSNPSERSVYLFSHILNAQHIWAGRVLGLAPDYGVEQIHSIAAFQDISEKNLERLWKILESVPLDRTIVYTTSKGERFENNAGDILYHVINHSTYHRAQIASGLRQSGIVPPVTDYIILKREGLL